MQSVSSSAVSNALSYSTTEQLMGGKWIDGKPIYKKTFTFGAISANDSYQISTGGTSIDVLIKGEGCGYSGAFVPIVYADRLTSGILSWYWSENRIVVFTGSGRSLSSGAITLYYTKTS